MALCALGVCLSQTGTQITQDDNTRKQPLSDASVKIDGSTSWRSAVDSVVFDWSQVCLNWLVLLVLVILRIWLANAKRSLWRWWRNIFAERLSGCSLCIHAARFGWLTTNASRSLVHQHGTVSLEPWIMDDLKKVMGLRFQKYPFLSSFEGSFRLPHAMVARTNPDVTYAYIHIKRLRSAIWMHLKGRCSY
jgi:hypothetical protein